ncbi:MAG: hypothetical protein ACM3S0_07235 [Acidobacteriota bacterium]
MASQSSSEFWSQVGAADTDLEHLYGFLLERGVPLSSRELTVNLIEWRVHEEEKHLAELAARRAPVYQPKNTYEVGQSLVFTAFGNREGVVQSVRPGDNPRLGDFQVISVQLEGEPQAREFATAFTAQHPLNAEITQTAISLGVTPAEAVAQYGEAVRNALVQRLQADREFIHIGDQWFLRGLLPEIHPGYLNLAEAAIEQAGDAITTAELVKILDLPQNAKKSAVDFALGYVLAGDPRFEDVGPVDLSRWILTRMELPESRERPAVLNTSPARTVRLPAELEIIATDLYDSADSNGSINRPIAAPRDEVTIVLTYPHRRAGTLALVPPVRALLPDFARPRLKINFVDATSGDKFPGYAVAEGNYLAGLAGWYNMRRLSPGAYVTLRRGPEALTLTVDYQPQRERSLWVRVARGINGRLVFAQEKRPLSHKYDEEMLIVVADPVGLDTVAQTAREQKPLPQLLEDIFPELAKLSGAGHVHAKTLYSAVNLIRRIGPRAVLSALTESRAFSPVGGGYFVLTEQARV